MAVAVSGLVCFACISMICAAFAGANPRVFVLRALLHVLLSAAQVVAKDATVIQGCELPGSLIGAMLRGYKLLPLFALASQLHSLCVRLLVTVQPLLSVAQFVWCC